jgi:hypothetical protein
MDIKKIFKDAVSVLKLDQNKMLEVSSDKSATIWGVIILAVPPLLNLLLTSLAFPSGFGVIFSRFLLWPILVPVLAVSATIILMSVLAVKAFKGQGSYINFFRTVSYAGIALWATIIPYLLAIFGLIDPVGLYNLVWLAALAWMVVVSYHMLLKYHKVTQQDAVIIIVIGVLGFFILRSILGEILVGSSYRFWY